MCIQLSTSEYQSAPRALSSPRKSRAAKTYPREPEPLYAGGLRSNREIKALVAAVEEATLPRQEWRHAEHLIVALHYARRYRPGDAMRRLRTTLQRYNEARPSGPGRGYHETITLAWFHLVRHFLDVYDDGRSVAALAESLTTSFTKAKLFEHWSLEALRSPEARAHWVEPDLMPLPALQEMTREDREWLAGLTSRLPASASPREPVTISPVATVIPPQVPVAV
jgi:hypothetical protein